MKNRRAWLLVVSVWVLAPAAAAAQEPQEGTAQEQAAPPGQPTTAEEQPPAATVQEGTTDLEEEALRLVEEILREQQTIISGENFVYRADGRRDPFRNLLQTRQRQLDLPAQRPAGLPGFLVGELQVLAVAQYQGRWQAMVEALDRRTYFLQVGTALFDGRVIEINDREVVFEQEVQDMMGARSTRNVVKRLNTGTQEQLP